MGPLPQGILRGKETACAVKERFMKSIRELYTIGRGPSSSHTMGPARAAALFRSEHPEADHFRVVLYGSLALTGRGHLTDQAVREAWTR